MDVLLESLGRLFDPTILAWLVIGFMSGMIVGAIPGLNESTFLAIVLPFTLYLDAMTAIIVMTAVYTGAEVGGEIPSILVRIPGTIGAVATTFEGYPLTLQGRANYALGASLFGSTIGAVIGSIAFLIFGPLLAIYTLRFRSPEMCLVAVLGMTAISSVTGKNLIKGLLSALLGLLIATTGADIITGTSRGTFGLAYLYDGIPFLPALLGLFGFSELMILIDREYITGRRRERQNFRELLQGVGAALRYPAALLRACFIGIIIGSIPGTGAATATVVSYGQARQWAKEPEAFGKGSVEGLISTDAANNACVPATLIPMLALGIPGSGTSMVLMASLILHGVRPGPGLWANFQLETYVIGFSVMLSAVLIIAMLPIVGAFALVARIKTKVLIPIVALMSIIGAYLWRSLMFDVWVMCIFGLLGLIINRYGYSPAALVLALILGPVAEENFFRSLKLGGVGIFFESPVAIGLLVAIVLSLFLPNLIKRGSKSS